MTRLSTIDHEALATVTGGDWVDDGPPIKQTQWLGNVFGKGMALAGDLSLKGAVVGGAIGAGVALAGEITIPAVALGAWGGAKIGAKVGLGIGFVAGAGIEAYRTWGKW